MTDRLLPLTTEAAEPETSRPDRSRVISGDPVHTTWTLDEGGGLYAGVWRSTPGAWRVVYDEWEYCILREGRSVVTGDDGSALRLGPGDAAVLRPGFSGVWEVVETTLKDFVVRLP
ncbi:cupin domain-containing protein [Wenxinia marina]|uniref:Putative enzyme of the cupin superfamily n=1 Tax=Wenxinia marina DSM 24838 TaxID=1123501 RepID=A0A0D0QBQ5_9RHOB|nr:cupin domain-containing protein [Wenxinia marina]KIQ68393.1 putative enzyme of the cupin superfamily [Wenxinia marina DSM 24838]GGL72565.1 cupin [Wenxinia marina]